MSKKATKAADNMYYLARCEVSACNDDFSSREKAAEIVGIDRTRLARIELDTITPYPEEVMPCPVPTTVPNSVTLIVQENVLSAKIMLLKLPLMILTDWP